MSEDSLDDTCRDIGSKVCPGIVYAPQNVTGTDMDILLMERSWINFPKDIVVNQMKVTVAWSNWRDKTDNCLSVLADLSCALALPKCGDGSVYGICQSLCIAYQDCLKPGSESSHKCSFPNSVDDAQTTETCSGYYSLDWSGGSLLKPLASSLLGGMTLFYILNQ